MTRTLIITGELEVHIAALDSQLPNVQHHQRERLIVCPVAVAQVNDDSSILQCPVEHGKGVFEVVNLMAFELKSSRKSDDDVRFRFHWKVGFAVHRR